MSPETKTKWPSKATREYTVLEPRRENALFIYENDWLRVRNLVSEIIPYTDGYKVVCSISIGVFVSFICVWISFKFSTVSIPGWAWTVDLCVISCSALMAILCFIFNRQLKLYTVRTVDNTLREMDDIRNRFEPSI